jgi:hypothetical protein
MTVPTDEAAPIDGHTPPDGAAHVAAPKAEAVPIAAPVPETAPADEDTLVIPEAWRTQLHPRRGGTPVPAPKRAADQTLDASTFPPPPRPSTRGIGTAGCASPPSTRSPRPRPSGS